MKTAHIIVRGRVQGVGFRWFVQAEAMKIGLTGTVKNLVDGSVEIWVSGTEETIEELVDILKIGNGYCKVDDNIIDWSEDDRCWNDFRIST